MNWRVKGVIQKALSILPLGVAANDALRHALGGPRRLEREIDAKVRYDWLVFAAHLEQLGASMRDKEMLEIGAGWYPTLPMCFSLAGAGRCRTFDLTRHLDARMTDRLMRQLAVHLPDIARAAGRPLEAVEADYGRIVAAAGLGARLKAARIDYYSPADASRTGLPGESVDLVYSNSVLEHVEPGALRRIMAETARVLRPGGLAMHSVNCGDHYAYFDKSITQVNYLAYTEREWRFWNNDLQYQNRLRARDFVAMARESGLEIVLESFRARPQLLEQVAAMRIAPEFRDYPPEQLACTSIDFVARRPG